MNFANFMVQRWGPGCPLQCWILPLAVRLQAPPLAWVAPLGNQTRCLPHEPVSSEEWASFLRTGAVAAEPQQGYEDTGWDPGWEHSTGVYNDDKQVEHLGRWRDPKDALRRAVSSQWVANGFYLHV